MCLTLLGTLNLKLLNSLLTSTSTSSWLAETGKREQALKALAYLRGATETDSEVLLEMSGINRQLDETAARSQGLTCVPTPFTLAVVYELRQLLSSFKEVISPANRLRFFSAYCMAFFLMCDSTSLRQASADQAELARSPSFTGHNSILYYGPSIFSTIGYKSSGSLLASGLFGVIKVRAWCLTWSPGLLCSLGINRLGVCPYCKHLNQF